MAETLVACGGNECGDANKTVAEADGFTTTSGCASGHTHDFMISNAELASPPATETGDTTPYADDGHTHTVTLTAAQLTSISNGATVMVTTSVTNSHSHVFSFHKA